MPRRSILSTAQRASLLALLVANAPLVVEYEAPCRVSPRPSDAPLYRCALEFDTLVHNDLRLEGLGETQS